MRFETSAIVCALRSHAEHGAVVRLMTPAHGLVAAYVRGARGRRMRPVLIAGNLVVARVAARSEEQLPHAEVELVRSRAPLIREPLAAAAIEWATALTASVLPERHPYPRIHEALDAMLNAIEAAPSAIGWGPALVRFELLLLAELGFGLDREALPMFVREDTPAGWPDIADGLKLTGHLLDRDLLAERPRALAGARSRLVERLRRAGGLA